MERAPDVGMVDDALQAAGAVWRFWQIRAHFAEGRQILERLLAQPGASPSARAKALTAAGGIAYWQTDYEAVARHYPEARSLYEQMDDPGRLAEALYNEAYVPMLLRNIPASRPLLDRAMALYREAGNRTGAIEAEWFLGFTYFMEGEAEAALPPLTRAVDAYRAAGAKWSLADSLVGLANVRAALGQWPAAIASVRESLALFRDLRNELGQALLFESVGNFAAWLGDAERAARLLGASDRMKQQVGGGAPSRLFVSDAYRHKARRELGAETFDRLAVEGAQLTLDEVAKLAETFDPPPDAPAVARLIRSDGGDDT